jgi:hypothetical protein
VDRSVRRRGQLLVVVGALLGALVGVVLGLAVGDGRTDTAVAAPTRARSAAAAAAAPTSQPTGASTSRLRVSSVDRPGKAKSKASKDGKRPPKEKHKGHGDDATGRSNKDKR